MRKFINTLLLFSSVFISVIISLSIIYVIYDPFKVIYSYGSFYNSNDKVIFHINQDYVSTSTYIRYNDTMKYNSFIFGNSRSIFYPVAEWKKYLDKNSSCYHFDASAESLWAINKKIEYINNKKNKIDNVLLVLDYAILKRDKPLKGMLFVTSPQLLNYTNIITFHKTFYLAFLNPKFLYAFLDYSITKKVKKYMTDNYLIDDRRRNYDSLRNEMSFEFVEQQIENGTYYTKEKIAEFYKRDTTKLRISAPVIQDSQKDLLENIHSILEKNNTSVKVVISPLYDQMKLNPQDVVYLQNLFGNDNVFDFSGINKYTSDYQNYYETEHYRSVVSKDLLKIIYQNDTLK